MIVRRRIGIMVRQARQRANMTVDQAAAATERMVSRPYWSQIEVGTRPIPADPWAVWTMCYGVFADDDSRKLQAKLGPIILAEKIAWHLVSVGEWRNIVEAILFSFRDQQAITFQALEGQVSLAEILLDPSLTPSKGLAATKTYPMLTLDNYYSWPTPATVDLLVTASDSLRFNYSKGEFEVVVSTPQKELTIVSSIPRPWPTKPKTR